MNMIFKIYLMNIYLTYIQIEHLNELPLFDWESPGLSALATWDGHLPGVRIELPPRRGQPLGPGTSRDPGHPGGTRGWTWHVSGGFSNGSSTVPVFEMDFLLFMEF